MSSSNLIIISLLLIIQAFTFGQDSSQTEKFHYNWAGGLHFGSYYSVLSGEINRSFKNTSVGFKIGFELEYQRIFTNFDAGWANAKTKLYPKSESDWIENLPLDSEEIIFSIGYRILFHPTWSIKPMITTNHVMYKTDDRVKDFTKIEKEYEFTYLGFDIALVSHTESINYGGFELIAGIGLPVDAIGIERLGGAVWRFSIGYRGFSAH